MQPSYPALRLRRWVVFTRPGSGRGPLPAPSVWDGSWNDALHDPSAASAAGAITCVIGAARGQGAWGRAPCKRQASGSNPLTGSKVRGYMVPLRAASVESNVESTAFSALPCRYAEGRQRSHSNFRAGRSGSWCSPGTTRPPGVDSTSSPPSGARPRRRSSSVGGPGVGPGPGSPERARWEADLQEQRQRRSGRAS